MNVLERVKTSVPGLSGAIRQPRDGSWNALVVDFRIP